MLFVERYKSPFFDGLWHIMLGVPPKNDNKKKARLVGKFSIKKYRRGDGIFLALRFETNLNICSENQ